MATPKEIHNRVMLILGFFFLFMGLAAAYLAFSSGGLPPFFYGFHSSPAQEPVMRRLKPDLIRWNDWSRKDFSKAKKSDRLVLFDISAKWSRASELTDGILYADPNTAAFIQSRLVPIRADADARPDLALVYRPRAWPVIDVLSPTGEILAQGSAMPPELFMAWAGEIFSAYRRRLGHAALSIPNNGNASMSQKVSPDIASFHRELAETWNSSSEYSESRPFFPFFNRIYYLQNTPYPWALDLAKQGAQEDVHLQDSQWGGFYLYAWGPGCSRPATGKKLSEQAAAIMALAPIEPQEAKKAAAYVDKFLTDPAGGYYSSQAPDLQTPDGAVIDGDYYFSLPNRRRLARGVPKVDRRIFAAANGLMARAVLQNRSVLGVIDTKHALATLNLWWKKGIKNGCVLHEISDSNGLSCYLEDQTDLGLAFLAAADVSNAAQNIRRALSVALASEHNLLDTTTRALKDAPDLGQAAAQRTAILDPTLNAEALIFYLNLAKRLPEGPDKRLFEARAAQLRSWTCRRLGELDPALAVYLTASSSEFDKMP